MRVSGTRGAHANANPRRTPTRKADAIRATAPVRRQTINKPTVRSIRAADGPASVLRPEKCHASRPLA